MRNNRTNGLYPSYDPCMNEETPLYMKRKDVLKSLHADSHPNPKWPAPRKGWTYGSETADIALLFPEFFKRAPHWHIAVVSGTADSAVPFLGSQRWIECLGRKVVKDWFFWDIDGDVAGAIKRYGTGFHSPFVV